MDKGKLCGFALAGIIGLVGISPIATITTFAAETNTESVTLSEKNDNQKVKKAAFEKKMKQANEKWKTLTTEQKEEVYALLENEMLAQNNLMDKLVELGVLEKEDIDSFKTHMLENFNKVKESGEFPLLRHKGK